MFVAPIVVGTPGGRADISILRICIGDSMGVFFRVVTNSNEGHLRVPMVIEWPMSLLGDFRSLVCRSFWNLLELAWVRFASGSILSVRLVLQGIIKLFYGCMFAL